MIESGQRFNLPSRSQLIVAAFTRLPDVIGHQLLPISSLSIFPSTPEPELKLRSPLAH